MAKLPQWATPDRQTYLLSLWERYGNKCLLGHDVCPNPEHYIYLDKPKIVIVGKPVKVKCADRNGNPIKDTEGNQLYLTAYKPVKDYIPNVKQGRLYEVISEQTISYWKADDREQRLAEWEAELKAIHSLGEHFHPLRGQFSAISRDIWGSGQPLFYIEGLSINALTMKPFVKVRLSSSYMRLYIDLDDTLRKVGKVKRRKAIRYGKPLPQSVENEVAVKVREAVQSYLNE